MLPHCNVIFHQCQQKLHRNDHTNKQIKLQSSPPRPQLNFKCHFHFSCFASTRIKLTSVPTPNYIQDLQTFVIRAISRDNLVPLPTFYCLKAKSSVSHSTEKMILITLVTNVRYYPHDFKWSQY